jgi:aminobenzoyl-glutamate utilization protein B
MSNADRIWSLVEAHRERFVTLADTIWEMPEVAYAEFRSVEAHVQALAEKGFRIVRDLAGIPTAVMGEAGTGGPVIAILGEYDALPGLSQEAGVAEERPRPGESAGHGCGHNLLGSAAMLAAVAVRDWLAETGRPGRVRYYGCPAEEGGAAKAFMVRAGAFADVDAAISWHPAPYNRVDLGRSLANMRTDFTFHGRASHASASPELGRSALDAVELMNIGINYLREHMPPDCRVHYAYIDAGGAAPNVVQARATVRQLVRAPDLKGLRALLARVRKIAEGAALMTGTRVEERIQTAVSNIVFNPVLARVMQANLDRLGAPAFDAGDRAFARAIQATLTDEDIATDWARMGRDPDPAKPLADFVVPLETAGKGAEGSTDLGDVSWAVPFVEARVATCAIGTPFHTWQLTAQGKSPAAHKGMVHAAKLMAGTAIDLLQDPVTIERARALHRAHLAREPYECPMPAEVMPPLRPRPD